MGIFVRCQLGPLISLLVSRNAFVGWTISIVISGLAFRSGNRCTYDLLEGSSGCARNPISSDVVCPPHAGGSSSFLLHLLCAAGIAPSCGCLLSAPLAVGCVHETAVWARSGCRVERIHERSRLTSG